MPKKLLGGVRDGRISTSKQTPSLIMISVDINGQQVQAMVDTGATISIISQQVLDAVSHAPANPTTSTATLGDGLTQIKVNGTIELPVKINDLIFDTVYLWSNLWEHR